MDNKKIFITEPSLPPLSDFQLLLGKIWESKILTNNGPISQELAIAIANYLNVPNVSLLSSGTTALFSAIKTLDVTGEVITTPFTFSATSQQIKLAGATPVFVDIDQTNFNINPSRIKEAITQKTSAILAVHCFGVPCDVDSIQDIADEHGLKVIYDAAHAFGVDCHCGELFSKGDASVLSFHATKVYNTFEGGAVVSKSLQVKENVDQFKNFGVGESGISESSGINGKLNEISSAIGLLQLKYIEKQISSRKLVYEQYKRNLKGCQKIGFPDFNHLYKHNFSYLPLRINSTLNGARSKLINNMNKKNIFPKTYFDPLVSNLTEFCNEPSSRKYNLPIANQVASEILCVPIFETLKKSKIDEICDIILEL